MNRFTNPGITKSTDISCLLSFQILGSTFYNLLLPCYQTIHSLNLIKHVINITLSVFYLIRQHFDIP